MQYFVLNKDVITGVIHTDMEMHLKSAKYLPTTKESLATYQKWLASKPNQQPTIADIFSSTSNPSTKASVSTGASNTIKAPAAKPAAKSNRSALAKQFQQFINHR